MCVCVCVEHELFVYSDLKVHRDGRPGPFLLVVGRQQLNLSTDLRLLHASHTFDPKHTWTQKEMMMMYFESKKITRILCVCEVKNQREEVVKH